MLYALLRIREEARKTKMTYMVMPLFGAWCTN